MLAERAKTVASRLCDIKYVRFYGNGDVVRGGGSFGKKEHAQEEQYFRKKEREEIEKYREELEEASKQKKGSKPKDGQTKDQPAEAGK